MKRAGIGVGLHDDVVSAANVGKVGLVTFASTHTVLRSEMVKACVWPACTTWPGETSRSTTSPEMGASTGICDEAAAFGQVRRDS